VARLKTIKELIRIVKGNFMPKNPFELPSLYPSKPKRDSRRSFSRTQKKEILHQQDNKCGKCHRKLDPRAIHFHHKKPWSSGGRTITTNGRALCPSCHEILSHKERLKKVDKRKRKKQSSVFDLPKIDFP
jgi:5-methylcytosine-specific restriction endonuclease McrA